LPHLERLHHELDVPVVYVSHSVDEIVRLADEVLWLERGRIRAAGDAIEILGRLDFGAALGEEASSLLEASVRRHDERYELTELDSVWGPLFTHRLAQQVGQSVRLRIRARDVSLSLDDHENSSVLNRLPAKIAGTLAAAPGEVLVRLARPEGGAESLLAAITKKSYEELGLEDGVQVRARIKGVSVR
jgi:molybdate transport system ATP-binding protein